MLKSTVYKFALTAMAFFLISVFSGHAFSQTKGDSVLIIDPQESRRLEARAQNVRQQKLNQGPLVNDASSSKTILRFTGTPRTDLQAFNFEVTTTETDCVEKCEFHWLVNQGTKVSSKRLGAKGLGGLKPNTSYVVEWIKSDAKNPRLIQEIKLVN